MDPAVRPESKSSPLPTVVILAALFTRQVFAFSVPLAAWDLSCVTREARAEPTNPNAPESPNQIPARINDMRISSLDRPDGRFHAPCPSALKSISAAGFPVPH